MTKRCNNSCNNVDKSYHIYFFYTDQKSDLQEINIELM